MPQGHPTLGTRKLGLFIHELLLVIGPELAEAGFELVTF